MEKDELLSVAAQLIIENKMPSTSFMQRRMKIGFSRAGRIMQQLQDAGIVGEYKQTAPRDLLITDLDEANNLINKL